MLKQDKTKVTIKDFAMAFLMWTSVAMIYLIITNIK